MALKVDGVTDDNVLGVCSSIESALDGITHACTLSNTRRRLQANSSSLVYASIYVRDFNVALSQVQDLNFIASLENLPDAISISEIAIRSNMSN